MLRNCGGEIGMLVCKACTLIPPLVNINAKYHINSSSITYMSVQQSSSQVSRRRIPRSPVQCHRVNNVARTRPAPTAGHGAQHNYIWNITIIPFTAHHTTPHNTNNQKIYYNTFIQKIYNNTYPEKLKLKFFTYTIYVYTAKIALKKLKLKLLRIYVTTEKYDPSFSHSDVK